MFLIQCYYLVSIQSMYTRHWTYSILTLIWKGKNVDIEKTVNTLTYISSFMMINANTIKS